jgi:hypothetical protein
MLAISPFLIFYSRYARTYELMMFLCFWDLLLFHGWLTTAKFRYAAGFAVTAIAAGYTHLFSFVAIFAPLALMIGFKLAHRLKLRFPAGRQIAVSGKALCLMTFVLLLALTPLMVPVLLKSNQLPWEKGKLTWEGVITAATLLSGTVNLPLNVLFFLLGILGLRRLFNFDALLGWIFLCTTGGYITVLLITRPLGLNIGAVLLRYMVVTVPLTLTAVAVGLEWFLALSQKLKRMHRSLSILAAGSFMACLYVTGPLPAQHFLPNNFTNHSAFQGSYRHMTWEYSEANSVYPAFSVKADQIPSFYRWLGGQTNIETIIEYPFDICDYNDLFYYYQHFHRKRVIAGYCTDPALNGYEYAVPPDQNKTRFSVGTLSADMCLSPVTDPTKLKFRNLIDVTDPAALLRCHADFIILHKYIMVLKIIRGGAKAASTYGTMRIYYRSVPLLVPRFKEAFGQPVYEDEQIICFRLEPLGPE